MKKNNQIIIAVFLLLALGAAASFFSPHWTLYQLREAMDTRDADSLGDHVDFPAVRENLKAQFLARLNENMAKSETKDTGFEGLGQMMASVMVGPMLDALVTPAGIMALMSGKEPAVAIEESSTPEKESTEGKEIEKLPPLKIAYRSWSRVTATQKIEEDSKMVLVLKRDGLFAWRLTNVELDFPQK